jgi:hypothetical protein
MVRGWYCGLASALAGALRRFGGFRFLAIDILRGWCKS